MNSLEVNRGSCCENHFSMNCLLYLTETVNYWFCTTGNGCGILKRSKNRSRGEWVNTIVKDFTVCKTYFAILPVTWKSDISEIFITINPNFPLWNLVSFTWTRHCQFVCQPSIRHGFLSSWFMNESYTYQLFSLHAYQFFTAFRVNRWDSWDDLILSMWLINKNQHQQNLLEKFKYLSSKRHDTYI